MQNSMGCGKWVLAFLLPPLAVLDRGITAIILTTILTILGWIPGVIAAVVFNMKAAPGQNTTIIIQQGGSEQPRKDS